MEGPMEGHLEVCVAVRLVVRIGRQMRNNTSAWKDAKGD